MWMQRWVTVRAEWSSPAAIVSSETLISADAQGCAMMEAAPPRLPPEVVFHEGRRT
jgi:hypothetical protein